MSVTTGTIKEETSAIDGWITPDDGTADIRYSDEDYASKGLVVGSHVCYEILVIGDLKIATNLILIVDDGTEIIDGGVHDGDRTVGGHADPGKLLIIRGGAIINGSITVYKSGVIVEGASTVNGSIEAEQRSVIAIQAGSTVTGLVKSHQAINIYIKDSTLGGNVEFKAHPSSIDDSFTLLASSIIGDVSTEKGKNIVIGDNTPDGIGGGITTFRGKSVKVTNNKVKGITGVFVRRPDDKCKVCQNDVPNGDLDVPPACEADC